MESRFDTVLAVYTGSVLGSLTLIRANDDLQPSATSTSAVDFDAVEGTTYQIAIDGYHGTTGAWRLSWQLGKPVNDDFTGAVVLVGSSGSRSDCNLLASSELGEPSHAGTPAGKSLWYAWTALTSGNYAFNTYGSHVDTTLGVYTGTELTGLTSVAQNDNVDGNTSVSRVVFNATAGVTYRIAVDGYAFNGYVGQGLFRLNWSGTPAPNDRRANAIPLAGNTGMVDGANFFGSVEIGETNILAQPGGRSIWYAWTPASSGVATLSTAGSVIDTLLGVYLPGADGSLPMVAESDDIDPNADIRQSRVIFAVQGGVTYLVAIDGYGGEEGAIRLAWETKPEPVLLSVSADCVLNKLIVTFSEPLSSAGPRSNHEISDGTRVLSAVLADGGRAVWLFTDPLAAGVSYTLTMDKMQDLAGNLIPAGPARPFACSSGCGPAATLTIQRETSTTAIISWDGQGQLQSAPTLTGPWAAVSGAASPYTATLADVGNQFFRVICN